MLVFAAIKRLLLRQVPAKDGTVEPGNLGCTHRRQFGISDAGVCGVLGVEVAAARIMGHGLMDQHCLVQLEEVGDLAPCEREQKDSGGRL